ncbi:60S ribosomal protein L13a, partial [Araneus ventricosus]
MSIVRVARFATGVQYGQWEQSIVR